MNTIAEDLRMRQSSVANAMALSRCWHDLLRTERTNRAALLSTCVDLLLTEPLPIDEWPALLAYAMMHGVSKTSSPTDERERLQAVLHVLHERGLRVFDCEKARQAFESLPHTVTIYRGVLQRPRPGDSRHSVHWTPDLNTARAYASRRSRASSDWLQRTIFAATVRRENIVGMFVSGAERVTPGPCTTHEVLVLPEYLMDVRIVWEAPISEHCDRQ